MKFSTEKIRMLAKICRMYYDENMTQQEIAKSVGMSRSGVSRALTLAREDGIVKINIIDDYSEEQQCENELRHRFHLHDVSVVDTANADQTELNRRMASMITTILDTFLKDNDVIGVMAGYTVNGISEHIGYIKRNGLRIVPLVGGLGAIGANWQSDETAKNLANRLHCQYYKLNAPSCVMTRQAHTALLNEPEIRNVLDIARSSSVAIVGIGEIADSATLLRSGVLLTEDVAELEREKAVASICSSFLDINGKRLNVSTTKRMIGISAEDLHHIPRVIAVANGTRKVPAIVAALRSQSINIFVTDLSTAKAVLNYQG